MCGQGFFSDLFSILRSGRYLNMIKLCDTKGSFFLAHQAGQGLQEYLLPGLLIGVVALTATGALIQNGILLQGFQKTMNGTLNQRTLMLQAGSNLSSDKALELAPIKTYASSQDVSLFLTNIRGEPVTVLLKDFTGNLEDAIETNGADGTTRHHAQLIEALARDLLAKEVITPDQANSLISLANKGYFLADQQEVIKQAFAQVDFSKFQPITEKMTLSQIYSLSAGRIGEMRKIKVQDAKGQPTDLQKLVERVGFFGPPAWNIPGNLKSNESIGGAGEDIKAFLTAYKAAGTSGVLNQEPVATVISSLVSQILIASDMVESRHSQAEMVEIVAQTQAGSADICHVGDGKVAAKQQTNSYQCH
jgi:hypothetical protein